MNDTLRELGKTFGNWRVKVLLAKLSQQLTPSQDEDGRGAVREKLNAIQRKLEEEPSFDDDLNSLFRLSPALADDALTTIKECLDLGIQLKPAVEPKPSYSFYVPRMLGLIITGPTGTDYGQQVGGHANNDVSAEGLYHPISTPTYILEQLLAHFGPASLKWKGWCSEGVDLETAEFIDCLLEQIDITWIRVDRFRLKESQEAWVHVLVDDFKMDHANWQVRWGCAISGDNCMSRRGILTWPNSD